jgi:hypothetical protein
LEKHTWTTSEINYLKENYHNTSNLKLAEYLNISIDFIQRCAYKLKLKKSNEYHKNMMTERNKSMGRDLSFEKLTEIALKYKSRGEFQNNDSSAYSVAIRSGWLDQICSHMISQSYSIPQLILFKIISIILNDKNLMYNTRQIIKPYELDVYSKKYNIAFEYNGKGWHLENDNDNKKQLLCINKNIKLIYIIENNRNYINDVKTQLIQKLNEINEYCNLNILENDIVNDEILNNYIHDNIIDEETIIKIINKYTLYHDFIKNEQSLYAKLLKLKKLDYYTKDLIKAHVNWNLENVNEEISKYVYLDDFIKNSSGCYIYIKRYNLKCDIDKLIYKRKQWNFTIIKELIIQYKYKTPCQLKKEYPSAYCFIRKNKLLNDCKIFIKENILN